MHDIVFNLMSVCTRAYIIIIIKLLLYSIGYNFFGKIQNRDSTSITTYFAMKSRIMMHSNHVYYLQ